ncbi:hypothetical protein V6N11_068321 [Hibiscus sabdariffa]|uniref:Uncharacterized protein n=2 Tax=Hibiscus sabdariffa TaxID=183260 RepID=A0ABR2B675_9ROSI
MLLGGYSFDCSQCQTDCVEAHKLVANGLLHDSPLALVRAIAIMCSKAWIVDFVLISILLNPMPHLEALLHKDHYGPSYWCV